ncbi:hypothetical protein O9G_002246 [Rozella allomycis CSF55]|uniref:Uncharacterized protein n=1 Tax=Rozella allomycis (strain CSF55) TaxID=988480 RepID=A0A075B4B2_ROZAC|nr:hypothetical protein O9G_002246 [Rozella allomycis CSF55]|eukprot:EPZ36180.1 hypothetical protein O9G_002246 [Rozella allomycis CSF55]
MMTGFAPINETGLATGNGDNSLRYFGILSLRNSLNFIFGNPKIIKAKAMPQISFATNYFLIKKSSIFLKDCLNMIHLSNKEQRNEQSKLNPSNEQRGVENLDKHELVAKIALFQLDIRKIYEKACHRIDDISNKFLIGLIQNEII